MICVNVLLMLIPVMQDSKLFMFYPPTPAYPQAARSRKPKSRLEVRMEEERQARARQAEPRVPLVSRPTAARTQHMADLATELSSRSNSGENLRALCPRYPGSTVNPPIPRALANALEMGIRDDETREGRGKNCSGGSKIEDHGGAEVRKGSLPGQYEKWNDSYVYRKRGRRVP